jgi:broad specificity phosphatase PhoE
LLIVTTVLLVRHADIDLPPLSNNPPLNAAGRRRAATLARIAAGSGVTAIFTSTFTRTIQTVEPLVARLGLQGNVAPAPAVLAQQVTAGTLGSLVVIAGHSNTVPEIINALGVQPAPHAIGEREFDNLFIVTLVGGEAGLLHLKYGKQPD